MKHLSRIAIALAIVASGIVMSRITADEREGGRRSPESEAGQRRSAEGEGRRSPEAEAGQRRSAEGARGARQSPEARSRRPAGREGDRDAGRGGERESAVRTFRPQTEREAALYQMILQLQREVAELRRAIQSRDGRGGEDDGDGRRGDEARSSRSSRESSSGLRRLSSVEQRQARIFRGYDKNRDNKMSPNEFASLFEGGNTRSMFDTADRNRDGNLSLMEFIDYRMKRHLPDARGFGREGDAPRRERDRDGERSPRPDGEGERRGPRDGEGPRDGD